MDHAPITPTDFPEKERSSSDPDYDAWFRRQVEEGLADMEAGRAISHEAMMALLEAQNTAIDAARKA